MKILAYTPEGTACPSMAEALQKALGDVFTTTHAATLGQNLPSLVHVFGPCTTTVMRLLHKAIRHHIPIIYSPQGYLLPWNNKGIPYPVRLLLRHATVVHARSEFEFACLQQLDIHKFLVEIDDATSTQTITQAEMTVQMRRLYRKIVDTHVAQLLSENTKKIIYRLLQIAIDDLIITTDGLADTTRNMLNTLSDEEWRMLFLYAYDQGVDMEMRTALKRLAFKYPECDVKNIDRFPLSSKPEPIDRTPFTEINVETIVNSFLRLHDIAKHTPLLLCHYAGVYRLLRTGDYDETLLCQKLSEQHLETFALQVIGILTENLALNEGYIPTPFLPKSKIL